MAKSEQELTIMLVLVTDVGWVRAAVEEATGKSWSPAQWKQGRQWRRRAGNKICRAPRSRNAKRPQGQDGHEVDGEASS